MLAGIVVAFSIGLMVSISVAAPFNPVHCALPSDGSPFSRGSPHECDCSDVFEKARKSHDKAESETYYKCCLDKCSDELRRVFTKECVCMKFSEAELKLELEFHGQPSKTILDFQRCPGILSSLTQPRAKLNMVSTTSRILCWKELQEKTGIAKLSKPCDRCRDGDEEDPLAYDDELQDTAILSEFR